MNSAPQQQQQQQQQAPPATVVVAKKLDPVKRDGVLKEQVRSELEAKALWDKKWYFTNEIQKIRVEEAAKEGLSEEEFKKFHIVKPGKKSLEVEGWKYETEKYPVLSSGMVGWRSSRNECNLERFGSLYTSPRFTIKPPGRPPTPPQKFIILG